MSFGYSCGRIHFCYTVIVRAVVCGFRVCILFFMHFGFVRMRLLTFAPDESQSKSIKWNKHDNINSSSVSAKQKAHLRILVAAGRHGRLLHGLRVRRLVLVRRVHDRDGLRQHVFLGAGHVRWRHGFFQTRVRGRDVAGRGGDVGRRVTCAGQRRLDIVVVGVHRGSLFTLGGKKRDEITRLSMVVELNQ